MCYDAQKHAMGVFVETERAGLFLDSCTVVPYLSGEFKYTTVWCSLAFIYGRLNDVNGLRATDG